MYKSLPQNHETLTSINFIFYYHKLITFAPNKIANEIEKRKTCVN